MLPDGITLPFDDDRFWAKVDFNGPNGCWLWIGFKNEYGQGKTIRHGKQLAAHRYVFEAIHSGLPDRRPVIQTCGIPACVNPTHLAMKATAASPIVEQRFWGKVDRSGGENACWPWLGKRNPGGYGRFWLDGNTVQAHRFAYAVTFGPIPDDLWVLHHCDHPPCCNPAHFFIGDAAANAADRDAKGRQAKGDTSGTRLHPDKCIHYGADNVMHQLRDSPFVRLTEGDVREIRRLYAAGGVTLKQLAERYGVTFSNISALILRKSWAWLD